MGEAQLKQLRNQVGIGSRTLHVLEGEQFFARRSGIPVYFDDFSGSDLIRNLSSVDIRQDQKANRVRNGASRSEVVRRAQKATYLDSIIHAVMDVTHADMPRDQLHQARQTVTEELDNFEQNLPVYDMNVLDAILSATERYREADLLRGMDAFAEATREVHDRMYDATLIEPAQTFARWLIALEQS